MKKNNLPIILTSALALAGCISNQNNDIVQQEYRKVYGEELNDKAENSGLNILWITSDQQHWMAMGYNDSTISTPNLDRLARKGVVFNRAYCPNPTCTPTRASLITGQMPSQHGAYVLGTKLPESARTIGQELIDNGYETALIGKAHFQPLEGTSEFPSLEAYPILQDMDFWEEFNGPYYGFNHVELTRNHGDEAHVGQHYVLWMEAKLIAEGKDPETWKKWFSAPTGTAEKQYGEWNLPEEYHMNTWIAERTNAMMEEYAAGDKPFFLWASFFDPHPPYIVSGKWATMYDPDKMNIPNKVEGELDDMPEIYRMTQIKGADYSKFKDSDKWSAGLNYHSLPEETRRKDMAIYYGQISMMDHYIGKILDKVEELGIENKTVIAFTTDHGHLFGQHGLTKKGPFMYEDLVKVPMIVSCPSIMPQDIRNNSLQSLVDFAPTFLILAGVDVPNCMTGTDQSEVWKGAQEGLRDFVIVENHQQPYSLYQKQLVTERYKITVYMNYEYGELFDLKNDPNELVNLWDSTEHQELKLEMIRKLIQAEMKNEPLLVERTGAA